MKVETERKSRLDKNGRYLLARRPIIGENVMVINELNTYRGLWGKVVDYSPDWDSYGVQMDNHDIGVITDFYRFEIAWDHGR